MTTFLDPPSRLEVAVTLPGILLFMGGTAYVTLQSIRDARSDAMPVECVVDVREISENSTAYQTGLCEGLVSSAYTASEQ